MGGDIRFSGSNLFKSLPGFSLRVPNRKVLLRTSKQPQHAHLLALHPHVLFLDRMRSTPCIGNDKRYARLALGVKQLSEFLSDFEDGHRELGDQHLNL